MSTSLTFQFLKWFDPSRQTEVPGTKMDDNLRRGSRTLLTEFGRFLVFVMTIVGDIIINH